MKLHIVSGVSSRSRPTVKVILQCQSTNTLQLYHNGHQQHYSITAITTTTIIYTTPTCPQLEPQQTQLPPPLLISPQQLPPHLNSHHNDVHNNNVHRYH
ncbi:hypothetical protein DPMN_104657 [Dreissena polymorpha]|uniref:Uncharacterized protein n=1 Tax=Dreissena polymorpha TaxID=45954 RepID=A0A9D4HBZ7_DREPO|nr:hypothetical protein DPMN_104657 [Dreissena polymorpha]